jgi:hypothetical protein
MSNQIIRSTVLPQQSLPSPGSNQQSWLSSPYYIANCSQNRTSTVTTIPGTISTVTSVKTPNTPSVYELSRKIDSLLGIIKDVTNRTNSILNLDGNLLSEVQKINNAGKVLRISEDGLTLVWDDIIIYTDVPPGPKSALFPYDPKSTNLYLYIRDGQNTIVYKWNPTTQEYINIGALVKYDNITETMSIGTNALFFNTSGQNNIAFGRSSLQDNTIGNDNISIGEAVLKLNVSGNDNIGLGNSALTENILGSQNVAIGRNSGNNLKTGDDNIYIGSDDIFAVASSSSESNTTKIGNTSTTHTFISGIRGTTTDMADTIPVLIDSMGQLGTLSSSIKYKENVEDMKDQSKFIYDLRPVVFNYKGHHNKKMQYGLIAEEVDKVNPSLVVYKDKEPETVHYDKLISALLNEVQKLNKEVQELKKSK